MIEEQDDLIQRAAAALRRRHAPNARLVSRVLASVEGRPRRWWQSIGWSSSPVSLAATATLAAAGLLLGFVTHDLTDRPARDAGLDAPRGADALSMVPASRASAEALPVPVQFTLRDVPAGQVALVGDFNDWSQNATLLEPGAVPGTWSVTVPLTAGRHVYAFIVDGKTWMTDPRAQTARDLDFGRANSVLIVQAP